MNEEYLKSLYEWLGNNDATYPKDVPYDQFISKMQDPAYVQKLHGWLVSQDPSFGVDLPIDAFNKKIKGAAVTQQPTEVKKKDTTVLPSGLGSSASSASADPEALRFAELVSKQGQVVGKRRDEPNYIDPRKKLSMYPTQEETNKAMTQFVADIDASKGMAAEYEEKDFFEGGVKSTLRFLDTYIPGNLGEAIDDTARTLASGYATGQLISAGNDLMLTGKLPNDEDIDNLIKYDKMVKELGPSDALIKFQKKSEETGGGWFGFLRGVMDNPTVLPELLVNSAATMATNKEAILAGAGTVLTNALATAATAGAPTAGVGAAPGFIAGATAAIPVAMGLASGIVTTGATFAELLQQELGTDENGNPVEPTQENIKAVLENPEKFNRIRNKSIVKGAAVGFIDFVTGRTASAVGAKILSKSAAKSATGEATKAAYTTSVGAGSAIESTGGAFGEFAGTALAGEKQSLENILFEGITEMPLGALSTFQARMATPVYKVNNKKVTGEQLDEIIDTMEPADLAKANIKIENDYEGRNKRMQDKVVTGAIASEVRAAKPELNDATVNAIVGLQKQLDALDGNKTQVAKDKAAQIKAEIKNLEENPIIETKPTEQDAIQEQAAGQVPVQSGATVSEEVAQGEPQAELKITPQEIVQEEIIPEVITEEVVTPEVITEPESLIDTDFDEDGDLTDEGFAKAETSLKSIIEEEARNNGIPLDILLKHYNINSRGEYFSSTQPILQVSESNNYQRVIKTLKDIAFKMFPDRIDELNEQINSYSQDFLDSYQRGDEGIVLDKSHGKLISALDNINNRFNQFTNPQKVTQSEVVSSETQPTVSPAPTKKGKAKPAAVKAVSPTVSPEPIVITDILKDIKVSFAPENAIEVQKGTREDTRGKKFTYDAAVTSQATDRNGTPIGLITKRSNEDGVLSFTLKNTSGQNINKGKAYPTERDARTALAEQVNRVRAKAAAQPAAPTPTPAPAPTPTAPVVEVVAPEPVAAPTPEPILIDDQEEAILVTEKEIKSNLPKFTRDNAIEYDTDYKEDSMGREVEYTSSLTVEALDIDGVEIGTITKLIDDEKNVTYTAQDSDRTDVGRGKEYNSEAEVIKALTEHINKKRKKEFDKEVAKIVKAREKAAAKVKLAEERKAAKQAAKTKTPEVDAVIEEDANAEGVLERSLDFLDNASKSIGKRLKTNANDALLGIPLSTLKLAIDAARVLVRAGVALRDAIAKVSKDYNLAAKDVEESLKVVSEQAEKEAAAAMPMSADNVKYSDSDVLPKPDKKVSNSTVAKLLQEVAANFWGGSIVTSETITPEQERLITINGTEETIRAFESSDKNAADWYSKAIETAIAVAGVIHPELASAEDASKIEAFAKEKNPVKAAQMALRMALAITSQNINVDQNTTYAEEQFNYYKKNGKFDPSKKYGAKAPAISSNLKLANLLIDKLGLNGAENFVSQDFTVNQLEEAFQNATGKKVKISGLRNDDVNGAAIFGPKIGQGFLQNLMGKFDPVTIDLWMRRTWGRWTGDVVGTGVTDKRMARLILAVNEAVKNKEIPKSLIPKEFFEYKPVQERNEGGDLFWTMNDKFNDRIENDLDFLDVLNKFTKELTRQANNLYKAVHDIPMTKELYGKFLSGEMSYFEVANKLMSLDSKLKDNYSKYVANQKSKGLKALPLNDKKVNDEIVKGYKSTEYARLGNIYSPSNEEISQRKPIWGNAAKNIVVDLNPIDIPSNLDRRVITRVVNNIRKNVNARGYNVTNADVQALLWYPEKDIWAKLRGEEESILKLSYDDQFIKIAKERGLGKQAEAVAEDIRGRRTESDVRKDERRTDGKVSSRVDELAEIDVKTPSNAEVVINFLDGVDKAIAKVLKTQANDALLGIPLTAVRGMIQGIKALVETGVKLRDAINKIAKENNITQENLKDILNISTIQDEFNALMTKADKLIARQKRNRIEPNRIVSNLERMTREFYKDMNLNDAQRKIMEREVRAKMGVEPKKSVSIGRVIGALKDITNVTREEKLKIISRIRELSRNAAKELAKDIRAMAANGQITTAQATNIISRFANVNMLNDTSVSNFVDYMADVFAKVKEKNRQSLLNDLLKLVSNKAKAAKTASGKRRSKGLDDIGQSFFAAIKPIIKAAVNKDMDALEQIRKSIDEDLINEIIIKNLNGEELTSRERVLLDQALAYDTFADVANMDIEQIQELYDQLKDARTESIARLKSKRIERAEQVKALHEQADTEIKDGYGVLYNEDGKLKDNNELADDVRDIWNSFNKLKVWDGVKKLFDRYDFSVATSIFDFMRKNMLHIGTLSKILDKKGTFFTDNIYRALNNMDENNLKGYFNQREVLDEMANKIKGITKGFKEFKSKMSNDVITLDNIVNTKTGKKRSTIMSQDEAMRIYALYKNSIQREKLTKMGFDEATMKKIEEFIGPDGKQLVDMVVDYFSTNYYESVNKVYKKVNDVSLGYVENYFPTQTISTGVGADMIIDGNFRGIFDAETAPSLKERTDTTGDVALGAGFTDVVDNHIQTMERYKAYAEGVKRINSIFKSPAVQALLGEYGTNLSRVYKSLINFSVNPNGGAKIEQSVLEKVMTKFTGFALAYKLIQIPKQATSFITAFEKYNYRGKGKKRIPGVDTVMFMVDMAKVIATLPSQVKKAQEISASFRDRLEKGLEGDVYGLESGGRVFKSISKSNTIWGKISRAWKNIGAGPTVIGDVLGVMGYMINYNRNIANGMSEADALEAFNDYNATQQSRRAADKIPLQQSQTALSRSFTMFGSTTFLQINKAVQGIAGIMGNLQDKKMPKAEDMRAVALNVALGNAFFVLMSNIAKLIDGDDEDREAVLTSVLEALLGLNLIYQVPLVGGAVEVAIKRAKGDLSPTSDTINPFITVFNKIYRGVKEDDILKAGQPIIEIILGTQIDQFIGLFNTIGEMEFKSENVYDMLGITKSYRPGSSSKKSKSTPSEKKGMTKAEQAEMKKEMPDLYQEIYGERDEIMKEMKRDLKETREEYDMED
jgi:hypothetical protein